MANSMVLSATPASRTVDYDENVTSLYEAIGNSDWDAATHLSSQSNEASTWVVRYKRDSYGNKSGVLWRFLPIHSACALNPPVDFLRALVKAYPDGPRTVDDQGMHPLHYACGARASREVIYLLLMSFPQAAMRSDPNGMLPLHYLAQWGPSNMGVLDMLLVATGRMCNASDKDGNSPYNLAKKAMFNGCGEVALHIHNHLVTKGLIDGNNGGSGGASNSHNNNVMSTIGNVGVVTTPRASSNNSISDVSAYKRNLIINVNTAADKYASFEDDITETVAHGYNPMDDRKIHTSTGSVTQYETMETGEIEISLSHCGSENQNHLNNNNINNNKSRLTPRGTNQFGSWKNNNQHGSSPSNHNNWDNRSVSITPNHHYQQQQQQHNNNGKNAMFSSPYNTNDSHGQQPSSLTRVRVNSWSDFQGLNKYGASSSTNIHGGTTPTSRTRGRSFSWDEQQLHSSIQAADSVLDFISSAANDPAGSSGSNNTGINSSNNGANYGSGNRNMNQHNYSHNSYDNKHRGNNNANDPALVTMASTKMKTYSSSPRSAFPPLSPKGVPTPRSGGHKTNVRMADRLLSEVRDDKESVDNSGGRSSSYSSHLRSEVERLRASNNNNTTTNSTIRMEVEHRDDILLHHHQRERDDVESCLTIGQDPPDEHEAELEGRRQLVAPDPTPYNVSVDADNKAQIEIELKRKESMERDAASKASSSSASRSSVGSASEVIDPVEDIVLESKSSSKDYTSLVVEEERKKMMAMLEKEKKKHEEEKRSLEEERQRLEEEKASGKKMAMAMLEDEKAKSKVLENQLAVLKEEIENAQKTHGEAVFTHLQEVKSLRGSLEKATVEIEKRSGEGSHDKCTREKENLEKSLREEMANKENEWNEEREKLDAEIKCLTEKVWAAQNAEHSLRGELREKEREWAEERSELESNIKSSYSDNKNGIQAADSYSVASTLNTQTLFGLASNSSMNHGDNAGLRMQLETSRNEAEEMRKYNAAIRKEHGETISELERELENERSSKTELLSQIVTLQYRIATLEQELEDAHDDMDNRSHMDAVEVDLFGMKSKLAETLNEAESSKKAMDSVRMEFQEKEQVLLDKLQEANSKIRSLEHKMLLETQFHGDDETKGLLLDAQHKAQFLEDKERTLLQQLDEARRHEKMLIEQGRSYQKQLEDAKKQQHTIQQMEDSYAQQIRDAKKKIQELQEKEDAHQHQLWEAKKQQEYAVHDKEDEHVQKLRVVKKELEKTLLEKEDAHLRQIRELKKSHEKEFRQKEEKYLQQLRESKKQQQALQEREDALLKEIQDAKLKDSFNVADQKILEQLEEAREHEARVVAELTAEIEQLKNESEKSGDDRMIADELEQQLMECRKDLERQRRRQKSELNKLNTTLELQKSKESRLQSHIKSMEAQITNMVSDYESRLQESFYSSVREN